MASPEENPNWVFDLDLIDDLTAPGGDLPPLEPGFHWPHNAFPASTSENGLPKNKSAGDSFDHKTPVILRRFAENLIFHDSQSRLILQLKRINKSENSNYIFGFPEQNLDETENIDCEQVCFHFMAPKSVECDDALPNSKSTKESGSRKRMRCGPSSASDSKAQREKIRRDKLNDRFQELSVLLDPERPAKADKVVILSDAARMLIQLRDEAQKLKESYEDLQAKVDELKAEKNELRDEKQKLKAEKDKLEQQLKALSPQPGFLPHPSAIPSLFPSPPQVFGSKLMPYVGYHPPLWHFIPPAAVDTSEDHVLHPPVA